MVWVPSGDHSLLFRDPRSLGNRRLGLTDWLYRIKEKGKYHKKIYVKSLSLSIQIVCMLICQGQTPQTNSNDDQPHACTTHHQNDQTRAPQNQVLPERWYMRNDDTSFFTNRSFNLWDWYRREQVSSFRKRAAFSFAGVKSAFEMLYLSIELILICGIKILRWDTTITNFYLWTYRGPPPSVIHPRWAGPHNNSVKPINNRRLQAVHNQTRSQCAIREVCSFHFANIGTLFKVVLGQAFSI